VDDKGFAAELAGNAIADFLNRSRGFIVGSDVKLHLDHAAHTGPRSSSTRRTSMFRGNELVISLIRLMSTVLDLRSRPRYETKFTESSTSFEDVWRTARTINSITHCGRSLVGASRARTRARELGMLRPSTYGDRGGGERGSRRELAGPGPL